MFGFQGGESAETVARKKISMKSARERWSFLTSFDLSTVRNAAQLGTMVKIRSSVPESQANSDVDAWLRTQPSLVEYAARPIGPEVEN
jgi:hypothetical protein